MQFFGVWVVDVDGCKIQMCVVMCQYMGEIGGVVSVVFVCIKVQVDDFVFGVFGQVCVDGFYIFVVEIELVDDGLILGQVVQVWMRVVFLCVGGGGVNFNKVKVVVY